MRNLMWSLGFSGCFAVSSEGRSGGLALFWVKECVVSLEHYSMNIIDVLINLEDGSVWKSTFVYGEPKTKQRYQFWDLLRFIRAHWNGPWLCAEDFNEALSSDEHLGRTRRGESQMKLFRECLENCGLLDLGFSGPKFTWNNRQEGINNVRVRLDRAVVNGQFLQLFDDCHVDNIITFSLDHYAILISIGRGGDTKDYRPVTQNF